MEIDLSSACVLNTSICPREWLEASKFKIANANYIQLYSSFLKPVDMMGIHLCEFIWVCGFVSIS